MRRAARSLRFGLCASVAAVWLTLPVIWVTFGELAPIGILLTPLAVPLIAWILTISWPLILLAPILEGIAPGAPYALAELIIAPAGELLGQLLWRADHLPGTPVVLPPRPALLLFAATWLGVVALVRSTYLASTGSAPRPSWMGIGSMGFGSVLLLPWSLAPPSAEVHILDVGHGTAALARLPSGAVWIYDGGSRDRLRVAQEALLPLLAKWDCPRPNYILSHNDLDHRSALPEVIQRHRPATWTGHLPIDLELLLPGDCQVRDMGQGRLALASEPGATLTLLRGTNAYGNEGSRTLQLDAPDKRILLWGDAESRGLLGMLPLLQDSHLPTTLLMPHHGSETALAAALFEASQPIQIWISGSGEAQLAPEIRRRAIPLSQTGEKGPLAW